MEHGLLFHRGLAAGLFGILAAVHMDLDLLLGLRLSLLNGTLRGCLLLLLGLNVFGSRLLGCFLHSLLEVPGLLLHGNLRADTGVNIGLHLGSLFAKVQGRAFHRLLGNGVDHRLHLLDIFHDLGPEKFHHAYCVGVAGQILGLQLLLLTLGTLHCGQSGVGLFLFLAQLVLRLLGILGTLACLVPGLLEHLLEADGSLPVLTLVGRTLHGVHAGGQLLHLPEQCVFYCCHCLLSPRLLRF